MKRRKKSKKEVSLFVHQAPSNYKLVNSFRQLLAIRKVRCLEASRGSWKLEKSREPFDDLEGRSDEVEVPRKLRDNCNAVGDDDAKSVLYIVARVLSLSVP